MKIIYETMMDAIHRAIRIADEKNKRIAKIELSISEANDIRDECRNLYNAGGFRYYTTEDYSKDIGYLFGVRLLIQDAPNKT